MPVRITLLADGSSDTILQPLISWLLREGGLKVPFEFVSAQFGTLRNRPVGLPNKVQAACSLYPCDLLFVHRDAENQPSQRRYAEIARACASLAEGGPEFICVVPIRMTESWFLFDRTAIAAAAGRPSVAGQIQIPRLVRLESVSQPKDTLHDVLRNASGLGGRRLRQFRPETVVHRLAELIDDYSPLRALSAFSRLEGDVRQVIPQIEAQFSTESDE